jgi:hypothetical protein
MRRLSVTLSYLLLTGLASEFAHAAAGEESPAKSEFMIAGKGEAGKPEDFRFRLGETLHIKASGELADKVANEWGKTRSLALYFDGVHISDLKSPPQQVDSGKTLLLDFALVRNAEDDASREAWNSLFRQKRGYLMTMQPSLATGGELPLVVRSAQPLQFYVASDMAIRLTLGGCLATLLVSYWYLVRRTRMLCDEGTSTYSLGKSQMAFWGILVLLSFVGVWILTGMMERIPPQVLILLGVSGATGLSAVVIGNSKKAEIQNAITEKQAGLAELREEEQKLVEQQAGAPDTFSPASQDRLVAIRVEIASRSKEMDASARQLAGGVSRGFWRDICNDGNGVSFHRLQVVVWTMVLGAVFIRTVAQVMSMPEFSETLLSLLGISNATYLGFKIPEKS